jgi:hypothetical protein
MNRARLLQTGECGSFAMSEPVGAEGAIGDGAPAHFRIRHSIGAFPYEVSRRRRARGGSRPLDSADDMACSAGGRRAQRRRAL